MSESGRRGRGTGLGCLATGGFCRHQGLLRALEVLGFRDAEGTRGVAGAGDSWETGYLGVLGMMRGVDWWCLFMTTPLMTKCKRYWRCTAAPGPNQPCPPPPPPCLPPSQGISGGGGGGGGSGTASSTGSSSAGVQYPVSGTRYSHRTGQSGPKTAQKGPFDPPKGSRATLESFLTGLGPMLDSITVPRPGRNWAKMGQNR